MQAPLLELGHEALQIAEIGFRQNRRNQGRRFGGYDLSDDVPECATDVIEKSHY